MGKVENLTLCINNLDYYSKIYNLNIMKTYEIIIELMQNTEFNKKLCFEMNTLSYIFKFLTFREYYKHKSNYYNPDTYFDNNIIDNNTDNDNILLFNDEENEKEISDEPLFIPEQFFFDSKEKRDELIKNTFYYIIYWRICCRYCPSNFHVFLVVYIYQLLI